MMQWCHCLRPASVEVATSSAKNSLEHSSETAPRSSVERGCETAEPQQDSSPNLRKPSPAKLPNVAFWGPKERWCNDAIAWSGLRGSGHFIRKMMPSTTIPSPLLWRAPLATRGSADYWWRDRFTWFSCYYTYCYFLLYIYIELLHPRNLTWNLKRSPSKRKLLLETIIFRFHVKFWGCRWLCWCFFSASTLRV